MQDFLFTLVLLGSIQGLIVTGLLCFQTQASMPAKLLAVILICLSLPGIHLFLHFHQVYEYNFLANVVHDIVPMVIIMPLGPLLYFYVRSHTGSVPTWSRRYNWHFLPVIIDLFPKLVAIVMYSGALFGIHVGSRSDFEGFDAWYNQYADLPRWISVSTYLWMSTRYLRRLKRKGEVSAARLVWPKRLITLFALFQGIWFFYLIPYLLPQYSSVLIAAVDWFPLYIPLTVLVYWLGIQGYFFTRHAVPRRTLPADWAREAWQKLTDSMEQDRLFLKPDLKVDGLAAHTGLSGRQVSELLNQFRETNFSGFVNSYRLREFMLQLEKGAAGQFTISGLARDCGFNSTASFHRIFRQSQGMTPTDYLRQLGHSDVAIGDKTGDCDS